MGAGAAAPKTAPAATTLRPDQVDLLIAMLKTAPQEGFSAKAFPTDGLEPARDGSAAAQAKLRKAAAAFARAEHGLSIAKDDFDKSWGMRPAPYDADKELRFAIAQDKLKTVFGFTPRYNALEVFERYRDGRGERSP